MESHDIIVIGHGLIGSAAAKYSAKNNFRVKLIGPDEPAVHEKAEIYASHFDQARIQRLIGKNEVWTRLNCDSVNAYQQIETNSKIKFHSAVSCYYVNPHGEDDYLKKSTSLAQQFNIKYNQLVQENLLNSEFKFPSSSEGIIEQAPSGFIDPRKLITAQSKIYESLGGICHKAVARNLSRQSDGSYYIYCTDNTIHHAEKILLCQGSFFNMSKLISKELDLKVKSETIILAEVSEATCSRLKNLPSLLYEINENGLDGIYLIQALQYPDGKYYIKMGCNLPEDIYFTTLQEANQWFEDGKSDDSLHKMKFQLEKLLPQIEFISFQTKRCIISRTTHGNPYIGKLENENIYLAGGCNGYSAMCSDAIGKVASHLISFGDYPEPYKEHDFQLVWKK